MKFLQDKTIGAILLIAGTSIGAAMLALPLSSALAGFNWSLVVLIGSWFFMYSTGLCIIEVASAIEGEHLSFITMADVTLGRWGGRITALLFFCLLYSLLAAYITGGGDVVQQNVRSLFNFPIPDGTGIFLWTLLFAGIIYYGVKISDGVNRFIMLGLFVSYIMLILILGQHVQLANLMHSDIHYIWIAIPVVFTAHAYHVVIPSVYHYLDNDAKRTKQALLYGSLVPLVLYAIWEGVVFGTLALSGDMSLIDVARSNHTTSRLTEVFQSISGSIAIGMFGRGFVFFAIASSFLGVALGLFDLIKDAGERWGMQPTRGMTLALTFLPAFIYGIAYPAGFIMALNYAGIFVAILHGLLPVLMVISQRYYLKCRAPYQMEGRGAILFALGIFFTGIIFLDIASSLDFLPNLNDLNGM